MSIFETGPIFNLTMSSFKKNSITFLQQDDISEQKEIELLKEEVLNKQKTATSARRKYQRAKSDLKYSQDKLERIRFSRLKRHGLNKLKDHVPDLLANIIEFIDSSKSLYNFILSSAVKQFANNMDQVIWKEKNFKKLFTTTNHVQIKSYVDAKKDKKQDYLMLAYESKLIKFQIIRDLYKQYQAEFPPFLHELDEESDENSKELLITPEPFMCACEKGRLNDIKLFMHYYMYMYKVSRQQQYKSIKTLLMYGGHASVSYIPDDLAYGVPDSAMVIAATCHHGDVLKYLFEFLESTPQFVNANLHPVKYIFFQMLEYIESNAEGPNPLPLDQTKTLNTLTVLLSIKTCLKLVNARSQIGQTPVDYIKNCIASVQEAIGANDIENTDRAEKIALRGKYQEIVELLRSKNGKTTKELYPLLYAIEHQEYDNFVSIFNNKPEIWRDDEGRNVFHHIARFGKNNTAKMIDHILSHDAIDSTAVFPACIAEDYIERSTPSRYAKRRHNLYFVDFVEFQRLKQVTLSRLTLRDIQRLMMYTVQFSDVALLSTLLSSKQQCAYRYENEIGNSDRTPLHVSCLYRVKNDIIELLLNSDFIHSIINRQDSGGKTALDYMLMSESTINSILRLGSNLFYPRKLHNKTSIIKLLESKGAKQGKDLPLPLHNAIEKQSGVKKILDRHNVGIDDTDKIGRNALHWCAWHGRNVKMFELLLLHRSYTQKALNRKDKQGHTPLDYAILFNRSKMKNEIVAFIQKNFGKRGEELKFL